MFTLYRLIERTHSTLNIYFCVIGKYTNSRLRCTMSREGLEKTNYKWFLTGGSIRDARPRKWIFPRGRTLSPLLVFLLPIHSGQRKGDRWRGKRAFPSAAPLEDSISVSLILQCWRARTKGTRAENTNYNDTRLAAGLLGGKHAVSGQFVHKFIGFRSCLDE